MPSRKKYEPKKYESGLEREKRQNDTYARIYTSLLHHPAFMGLSTKQKILYVYMSEARYIGGSKPSEKECKEYGWDYDNTFYFNIDLAVKCGLYSKGNRNRLYADIKALVNGGFIEYRSRKHKIQKQYNQYTKNVYMLSDKWYKSPLNTGDSDDSEPKKPYSKQSASKQSASCKKGASTSEGAKVPATKKVQAKEPKMTRDKFLNMHIERLSDIC